MSLAMVNSAGRQAPLLRRHVSETNRGKQVLSTREWDKIVKPGVGLPTGHCQTLAYEPDGAICNSMNKRGLGRFVFGNEGNS